MAITFVFRCPITGSNVQGFIAEEVPSNGESFVSVECLACRRLHMVNPKTGSVFGQDED
jgi:hypothetical protein